MNWRVGQPRKIHTGSGVGAMAISQQTVVFALSNPTSRSECRGQQRMNGQEKDAVFASGSRLPVLCRQQDVFAGTG